MNAPRWTCGRCGQRRLMDQTAEPCDRCTRVVCIDCWDREHQRCQVCADALFVDDEKVVDALRARRTMVADDVWRVLRNAWLAENRGKQGPPPSWWRDRVNDEIKTLRALGILTCHHGERCAYRRADDLWPLCEWRVVERQQVSA